MAERTIPRLWRDAVAAKRTGAAYLVEAEPGRWREVSWDEAARAVEELSNGLLGRGIRTGDTFGIVSRTRLEWTLFDFALARVGAITAPVYPSSSAKEAAYVLDHSDALGALVEDEAQREKVEPLRLAHVLTLDSLDELRAEGIAFSEENPEALAAAEAAIGEDDLYTYIYTSGTTGPPKACMILHRNYFTMVDEVSQVDDFTLERDVMLLFLPLAHNFGRCMTLLGARMGYTIAFCPDPYAVADALPAVRPTVFPSVPRVFEKVHTGVTTKFAEATGPKRSLIEWALRVGRRASELRQAGKSLPFGLALQKLKR